MSSSKKGFRLMKKPEKSNFVHTCNLLSQYVKEKGGLKDLNLVGISGKTGVSGKSNVTIPTTMNLLSNIGHPCPVDSLPRLSTVVPELDAAAAAEEIKRSQMTIFYGGEVLVFDDLPADKAREVMQLASNGTSSIGSNSALTKAEKHHSPDASLPSSSKAPPPPPVSSPERPPHPQVPQAVEANSSELPIARRSSLHRFLEKRKDRAVARGPYHHQPVQNQAPASTSTSSKSDEPEQEQLELKL